MWNRSTKQRKAAQRRNATVSAAEAERQQIEKARRAAAIQELQARFLYSRRMIKFAR